MEKNWNEIDLNYDFLKDDEEAVKKPCGSYKILISDDEPEIHRITKMMLQDFRFEGYAIEFIHAYNEAETIMALNRHKDIAILLQDVVMDKNDSGLRTINYLRNVLRNHFTRIILRTGQPGEAPEEKVIMEYDINDYCLKTDLTVSRFKTTLISALRSYRDIMRIDKYRKGLERIIEASANLFTHNSLSDFLTSILYQLSSFYMESEGIVYIREQADRQRMGGFVTMDQSNVPVVVAATGNYIEYIGKDIRTVDVLASIYQWMTDSKSNDALITHTGQGFIIRNSTVGELNNYIFIEGDRDIYDFELIKLFLANYSVALDNYLLNNMIFTSQKEIIITLGEIAEKHFAETGSHVSRVSEMMYKFARVMSFAQSECEKIRLSSILHDIGKIGLPDSILKKPGRLTEEEYDIVKRHPILGYEMLSKSNLEILHLASEIALYHHERFDGTGYPRSLKGEEIPMIARMIAIVDVYDAMSHKRVYKDAAPHEEIMEYIQAQKGKHFDGRLVDIFIDNFSRIADGSLI